MDMISMPLWWTVDMRGVYRFEDNAIVPGYIKYESAAQKEAKGLWADTNPVPPWQWRQANEKPRKVKEKK
nr:exported nuclease [Escherichia coli]